MSDNGYDTVLYGATYGLLTDIDGLNKSIDACNEYDINVYAWIVVRKTTAYSGAIRENPASDERFHTAADHDTRAQLRLCPPIWRVLLRFLQCASG